MANRVDTRVLINHIHLVFRVHNWPTIHVHLHCTWIYRQRCQFDVIVTWYYSTYMYSRPGPSAPPPHPHPLHHKQEALLAIIRCTYDHNNYLYAGYFEHSIYVCCSHINAAVWFHHTFWFHNFVQMWSCW